MRTRTLTRNAMFPLALATGLALLLLLASPFASKPVSAQIEPQAAGDGTTIFGGATSGTNTAVVVPVSGSANYVISATVPGGGNFYGAVVDITYDATKVTPTCAEETVNGSIRVYCNDGYPGSKVRIVIESSTVSGQNIVGMTGTNALVTISWAGIATTSSAISSMVVVGSCINGAGEALNPCTTNAGTLSVGAGGGGNVCTVSNVNLISGLNGTILWTGSAISLANMAAQLPANVTQVFEFTFSKQGHAFWFRSNPGISDMANGMQPGHFYLIRSNAAATLNVPNPNTFVPPGSGNLSAQVALNPAVWLNSTVTTPNIAAALPTAITQLFQFSTAKGGYQFWFRSNPGISDLSGGLNQCGGFLARSNASNTSVTGFLTPP